ncbi:hypothetical protein RFI_13427 [Reticulomyxa filosa]|uniref:Uncharacterized protein n=1 Tax=Reticulomyxa filosa TaxID=46433 RepID=X6NEH7_RETFI|nr:hypothetical protein RFI_13427 [Reticulomyxa filosa]|eukprot:ETO23752.1 hypothetical protein RFI_13427 [Reticulomyxa filosa]
MYCAIDSIPSLQMDTRNSKNAKEDEGKTNERNTNKHDEGKTASGYPLYDVRAKLPKSIYGEQILKCSDILKITEEQARKVYEVLLFERLKNCKRNRRIRCHRRSSTSCHDEGNDNNVESDSMKQQKMFRIFVKKRLLKDLIDTEGIEKYDEEQLKSKLQTMYEIEEQRYLHIIEKKEQWITNPKIDIVRMWNDIHQYPPRIFHQINANDHASDHDHTAPVSDGNIENKNLFDCISKQLRS